MGYFPAQLYRNTTYASALFCVSSNEQRIASKAYGKHIQDRVPADPAHVAPDVYRALLRGSERNVLGAGICRRHELRLLFLLRQNCLGDVSRPARDSRTVTACLCDR